MRTTNKILRIISGPLMSVFFTLVIGAILIVLIGKNPAEVYTRLLSDTLGSSYGLGQVLFKATPLIFTGLSVAFAFRAGLFNIGAEGQLNIGAFAAAWTGFTFFWMPPGLLVPFCIIAAFAGGAVWGGIAGFLKSRFGSHEVINTIMLNFIAAALVSYLVNNVYNVPATIHTPEISASAEILRFDNLFSIFKGSPFNLSFILAIILCIVVYYIIQNTRTGYDLKTLGFNRNAAEYAKMNITRLTTLAMCFAGGAAGLSGTNYVMGYKHYFELGFSEGAGFIGIAVALIARNNPGAIILVSLFFGMLEYGGLTINAMVPKELVTILQALLIFLVIIISKRSSRFKLLPKFVTND